MTTVLHRCNLF